MADADDSHEFLHLEGLIEMLLEVYDLVMENRFKDGITTEAMHHI